MIRLEKVNKYFNRRKKNEIHVINNADLKLDKAGLVALLGPSGSGKTTLLNVIGGLDKVNKGKIYVNNQKITRRSSRKIDKIRNLNIGYIFQDYKLVDDMTVFDNVALVLKMLGIKDKKEIKTRVNYVLETLNIYRYRNRYASMLSGGERQRVGIARAIVKEPDIIIADEPTGNLDSKNTLEIMNIIKSISKNRLVILVTHERDLANFYASRIIELEDGKVVKDYLNYEIDDLDYRLENNFYLKDFKNYQNVNDSNISLEYYSDQDADLELSIILKNGNLYIKNNTGAKVEVIDDDSSIELIDDHYKKIDKSVYQKYEFNFSEVINKNIKKRYTSIYNIFNLLILGFKKIFDYSFIKKVLLLGFFAASMFILLSYSQIFAALNIEDQDFVEVNKNYLQVIAKNIKVADYLEYENDESVNYILPGNSIVEFQIKLDDYYQSKDASEHMKGSLSDLNILKEDDIIHGKLPTSDNEIVIDLMVFNNLLNRQIIKQIGINSPEKIIGRDVYINNMNNFIIVGITDLASPSIYTNNEHFINIIANANDTFDSYGDYYFVETKSSQEPTSEILDITLFEEKINLTRGKLPENDYEIIVNYAMRYAMPLNKTIKDKINDTNLKVVGYYTSSKNFNHYFTNNNTIKYQLIAQKENLTIYSHNKDNALNSFRDRNLNVVDTYDNSKSNYQESKRESIISTIIVSSIIIAISLIEIFLMIRASFLSRIKEIGIFRAIGVKKSDIYKMFISEIMAITFTACLLGTIFMGYIIKVLTGISFLEGTLMINPFIITLAILTSVVFNLLVGLIPVYNTLRKTPAQILARHDLE